MEKLLTNGAQLTGENITADPRLVCSMECSHFNKAINATQIVSFVKDVCTSGQPLKLKTVSSH